MKVLAFYQEAKRVYGICPCCGELFRLSEATLFTKDPPPRTEFDAVDEARRKLDRAIEKFDDKEQALRDEALAIGQEAARKRLKRIAGPFVRRKEEALGMGSYETLARPSRAARGDHAAGG